MKPDKIAFHASSFCRQPLIAQSNVENMPPHTPKLPPVTGALAFMDETAPTKRSPCVIMTDDETTRAGRKWTDSWRVSRAFYAIPNATTDCTHRECTTKII
jgi:hypothetical protein